MKIDVQWSRRVESNDYNGWKFDSGYFGFNCTRKIAL